MMFRHHGPACTHAFCVCVGTWHEKMQDNFTTWCCLEVRFLNIFFSRLVSRKGNREGEARADLLHCAHSCYKSIARHLAMDDATLHTHPTGVSKVRMEEFLSNLQSGKLIVRNGSVQTKTDVSQFEKRYEQSLADNHGLRQENSKLRTRLKL